MADEGKNNGIGQNHMGQMLNYLNPNNNQSQPQNGTGANDNTNIQQGGNNSEPNEDQHENRSGSDSNKSPEANEQEHSKGGLNGNGGNIDDKGQNTDGGNKNDDNGNSGDDLNFKPDEKPIQLDDSIVLEYLNKKTGKSSSDISDYIKKPEAQSDPFEGLSDDWVQAIKFAKETNRPISDFIKATQDVDKMSAIDLARELTKEIDSSLTNEEIDEYLQEELNIDLSNPEGLTTIEKIRLERFVKDYRAQRKAQQEKYTQPIERQGASNDLVELPNGLKATKEQLEKFNNLRNQYLENLKSSADKITDSVFQVEIDDNGSKRQLEFAYEYSKSDKHSMLSDSSDVEAALQKMFTTENGLDAAALQEAMFWANPQNRAKAITSIIHKVIAERTEEFAKRRGNVNFGQKGMPKNQNRLSGDAIRIPGMQSGQRIPFSLEQFKTN